MTTTVDARGMPCPQPVILTRRAMQQGNQVTALVDGEAARTNVSRLAEKAGWAVTSVAEGGGYRLELRRGTEAALPEPMPTGRAERVRGARVLSVSGEKMGRGEAELGGILLRSFFHTLCEARLQPDTILFFNTGARLACEGSPVLEDLRALEETGIEILVCGTCLGHFGLKDRLAAGRVSNMYEIAETMLGADCVVNL